MKTLEARNEVLARLKGTLDELQHRAPSLPKMPGGVPKMAQGGGAAGLGMWVARAALKRKRKQKKKAKAASRRERKAVPQTAVSVKVFPSGTALAVVAAAALWAGVKVMEIQKRGPRSTSAVSPMRKGA